MLKKIPKQPSIHMSSLLDNKQHIALLSLVLAKNRALLMRLSTIGKGERAAHL